MLLLFLTFGKTHSSEVIPDKFVQLTYKNSWVTIVNPSNSPLSTTIKKRIPSSLRTLVVEPQNPKTPPFSGLYELKTLKNYGFTTTRTFYSEVTLPPLANLKTITIR